MHMVGMATWAMDWSSLAPDINHQSVSFKYDYPSSSRFTSHHIGYGDTYAKTVYDTCKIYGFYQYFDVNLIPGFSLEICQNFATRKHLHRIKKPYSQRTVLNIGTLARCEKIAQPQYLETGEKPLRC